MTSRAFFCPTANANALANRRYTSASEAWKQGTFTTLCLAYPRCQAGQARQAGQDDGARGESRSPVVARRGRRPPLRRLHRLDIGPQKAELELDSVEGFGAHAFVIGEGGEEKPAVFHEAKDLQGALDRVHQPSVAYALRGVDGHLLFAIETARPGRKHLA